MRVDARNALSNVCTGLNRSAPGIRSRKAPSGCTDARGDREPLLSEPAIALVGCKRRKYHRGLMKSLWFGAPGREIALAKPENRTLSKLREKVLERGKSPDTNQDRGRQV